MKKKNVIQEKTLIFSRKIVKLFIKLQKQQQYPLSDQLLRSGTSIGANVQEATGGSSKKDFLYKMKIAYKEARETDYWLKVLEEEYNINKVLFSDIKEILKILSAIIVSTKRQFHSEK